MFPIWDDAQQSHAMSGAFGSHQLRQNGAAVGTVATRLLGKTLGALAGIFFPGCDFVLLVFGHWSWKLYVQEGEYTTHINMFF